MKKFILYSLVTFILFSCDKVKDLDDSVTLEGFKVVSVAPLGIELGEPVIRGDTVFLPVVRGVALFPMTIHGEPIISNETKQAVPGGTFSSFSNIKFDLEDIHDTKFFLIAKSGLPKPYYIKLEIKDQSVKNDIYKVSIVDAPKDALLSAQTYINPIKNTISIYSVTNSFPLKLTASAVIVDNAVLMDGQSTPLDANNIPLSFTNITDVVPLKIEAEDGHSQNWTVQLKQAIPVNTNNSIDIQNAVKLFNGKQVIESKTTGFTIKGVYINDTLSTITLDITPGAALANLKVLSKLDILPNSQIIGYNPAEELVFKDHNSTIDFYILDNRSGVSRKWTYNLRQSDITDIYKFPFTYKDASKASNYFVFDSVPEINNVNNTILLKLTKSTTVSSYWPITVTPGNLLMSDGATALTSAMNFSNINSEQSFTVKSSGGIEALWTVKLRAPVTTQKNANIDSVKIIESSLSSLTNEHIVISKTSGDIFIDVPDKKAFPVRISPYIYISKGASFENFQNGDFLEFNSFDDIISINVLAENGDVKAWEIQLLNTTQLYNSDFELWSNSSTNMGAMSIDAIPGIGRGWATANNLMVKGTLPVDNTPYGLAAEMSTGKTSLPANLITAATLFLGRFDVGNLPLETPKKMTKFGIPFEARPTAIEIDAKYSPASLYQMSKHLSGQGVGAKYELVTITGEDKGHIWVELIHWAGTGALDYDGDPKEGVHVLARGEHIFSGTSGWNRIKVNLNKGPEYDTYAPTHFVVVMTSSIDGHLFKGAIGSKLIVDNFKLIY